jgi:arabinan endo-1,5-alpha-L-arabinosidase
MKAWGMLGIVMLAVAPTVAPSVAPTVAPSVVPAPATGDVTGVHDPTMVREGAWWYVLSTNDGMGIRRSADLVHWQWVGRVFPDGTPAWVRDHLPNVAPDLAWAPDLSYVDGRWNLYWSVADFGTKRAVTGLMTNSTLDPSSPDYRWVDQGLVLATDDSSPTAAIDTNAVTDEHGDRWLEWGSFWDGLFVRRLDPTTGKFLPGAPATNIARRKEWWQGVEGGYLVRRDGWWWLFASYGFCCHGVDSTYSVHVGRSRSLTGPYVDAAGRPLLAGGGTTLLGTYDDVIGPGHGSVVPVGDQVVLVHHFYDRAHQGVPTLSIRQLVWGPDGWPVAVDPGFTQVAPSPGDVVGQWELRDYPQECVSRSPDRATLTLRADGTVAPSGRWRVDGDLLRIEDVAVGAEPRDWWLLAGGDAGFGRDDRTAAVRARRVAGQRDETATTPCGPAPPQTPAPRPPSVPPPATPIGGLPPFTG